MKRLNRRSVFFWNIFLLIQWTFAATQEIPGPPADANITNALVNKIADETIELIRSGDEAILKNGKQKEVILVIGNTGAGKTTLTKFITGKQLESYRSGVSQYLIRDIEGKIGTVSTLVSKTIFPELFVDQESNDTFYDLPGFSDTRNASVELANSWFMKSVADQAERVKILVIINYSSLAHGEDRTGFVRLLDHATSFIQNPKKFEDSIAVVASKFPARHRSTTPVQNIGNFIQEQRSGLKEIFTEHDGKLSKVNEFLDAILKTDENGNYLRIGYFQQPSITGVLSEMATMVVRRKNLQQILGNATFVAKNASDFGITVSPGSMIYVNFIVEKLNVAFTDSIDQLAQFIQRNYDEKLKNTTAVFAYIGKFFQEIKELGGTAKSLENATDRNQFIQIINMHLNAILPQYTNFTSALDKQNKNLKFYEALNSKSKTVSPTVLEWLHPIQVVLTNLENKIQSEFATLNEDLDRKLEQLADTIYQNYRNACENVLEMTMDSLPTLQENLTGDIVLIQHLTEELTEELSFNVFSNLILKNLLPLKISVVQNFSLALLTDDIQLNSIPELRPTSWKIHFYVLLQKLTTLSSNLTESISTRRNDLSIASINANISALMEENENLVAAQRLQISELEKHAQEQNASVSLLDKHLTSLRQNYTARTSQFNEQTARLNETRMQAEIKARDAQRDLDQQQNYIKNLKLNQTRTQKAIKSNQKTHAKVLAEMEKAKRRLDIGDKFIVLNYTQIPDIFDVEGRRCSSLCQKYGNTNYYWCYLKQPVNGYWGKCWPNLQRYDFSRIKISSHGIPCKSKCSEGLMHHRGYGCQIQTTKFKSTGEDGQRTDYCSPGRNNNYLGGACTENCTVLHSGYYNQQCKTAGEYTYC